jgi:hypothetical protein
VCLNQVLFSEFDAESDASTEVGLNDDGDNEAEAGSADEFFEAEEIFSNADSHGGQKDADMISIASTDYAPGAEPRKSSPFSNIELDGSQDSPTDGMGFLLGTVNDEKTGTSAEANNNNEAAVVKPSLEAAVVRNRNGDISSSTCRDKDDDSKFENISSKQDTWISSNEDLSQIDNVLVKEVIISETNSPKYVQMIKEVIIS